MPCVVCGKEEAYYVLIGQPYCEECFIRQLDRFSTDAGRRAAMSQ
jgi:hypothetical protein